MQSFIFGGNTGRSYEDIKAQRDLANKIMARNLSRAPQSVGEGLNAVGQALLSRSMRKRANEAEQEARSGFEEEWNAALGGFGGEFGSDPAYEPASPGEAVAADTVAALGKDPQMKTYADAIASIESKGSGDYSAVGPTHPELGRALGRYGIMEANIGPWSREALGREVSADEFLSKPKIQDAIFNHKFGGYVEKYGPEGAAQAWFAGPGGVGKTGRKDVLGTSVGDYTQKFTRALGGNASRPTSSQADIAKLLALSNSPWASEGQRAVAQMLIGDYQRKQQMQARRNDPAYQLDLQYKQAQLDQMQNQQPDYPASVREFQFAKQNGFQGSYQDFLTAKQQAGAAQVSTTVNTGDKPGARPIVDKPPKGYQRRWNPETQSYVDEPIPGSEVATDKERTGTKLDLAVADYDRKFNLVDSKLDDAISVLGEKGRWVAGAGTILSGLPETDARDFKATLDTIKANLGFEELQSMRDNSPTGGALGQVSEREIAFLQAMQGNLDAAQSPEQLMQVLKEIKQRRADFRAERMRIMKGEQPQEGGGDVPQTFIDDLGGSDDAAAVWESMTPEERALWMN